MKLLIILSCLTLAACCPPQLKGKAPNFDPRLMELCKELPEATINSFDDVLLAKSSDNKLYIQCKNNHNGLVESIRVYQKEFDK